jgi:hypothetical protein
MTNKPIRTHSGLSLQRSYEVGRLQEQWMTAVYELLVPVVRRSLPSRSPATKQGEEGSARNRQQRQVVGGR